MTWSSDSTHKREKSANREYIDRNIFLVLCIHTAQRSPMILSIRFLFSFPGRASEGITGNGSQEHAARYIAASCSYTDCSAWKATSSTSAETLLTDPFAFLARLSTRGRQADTRPPQAASTRHQIICLDLGLGEARDVVVNERDIGVHRCHFCTYGDYHRLDRSRDRQGKGNRRNLFCHVYQYQIEAAM